MSKINVIFGCVLHLDIKDEKIWIQHDSADTGVADQLLEMGVPKEDFVLIAEQAMQYAKI